jgi:hypothetical protein
MIDASITVIDRLVQLLTVRERNREKQFLNIIEPLYQDTQAIMGDYTALFVELISQLEQDHDIPEIIRWIEARRMAFLPLRVKVRAFLDTFDSREQESMDRFQKGIWGVMKGGLSLVQEGHTNMMEYGWGDHTVLDLLYHWSHQPLGTHRPRLVENAKQQLASIQRAWADVAAGYASLKKKAFP